MTTAAIPEAVKVSHLADALHAIKGVRLNSTISVLNGIRITPTHLAVTNMEVSATVPLSGLDLDVLVNAAALRSAVEGFDPKANLIVGTEGGTLFLRAGRSEADLPLMEPADYPVLPEPVEVAVTLDADTFEELRHVAKMASEDTTRPVLMGVRIRWDESGLASFCATDSYRLAVWNGQLEGHGTAGDVLIPTSAVLGLPKGDGLDIGARPDGTHVTLYRGAARMVVRSIDGQHPDPDHLIPTEFVQARFAEDAVAEVARVVQTVGGGKPLRITLEPGSVEVLVEAADDSMRRRSTVTLTEPWAGSEPLTIGANPGFFVAMLGYGRGAFATIAHDGVSKPALRPMGFEDGPRRGLLMPIRIDS